MVTKSGRAKILDFGMAKPLEPAADDDITMKSTAALSMELTREGMVLGTVAYMSPEQATAKPVDSRSDVFSFGIMLYEMATGKRPFEGNSVPSTLAKILETEPRPLTDSREDLPYDFSRIIQRCLRKNREDRYNDTRDLAVALRDLMHETSSGAVRKADPAAAPRTISGRAIWAVAAAAVLVAGLGAAFLLPRLRQPSRIFVATSFKQVTFSGSASYPTLSPDGQSLAYATHRPEGGF